MSAPALRVPHVPQRNPLPDFKLLDVPGGGWVEINISATYYSGITYFGYINPSGEVRVASYNHTTHAVVVSPAIVSGLTVDLHNTPSVLVRSSDQKLLIAIAPHSAPHMYVAVSTNALDVSAWGAATDINGTLGGNELSYANLFQLSGESNKIYLFYRDFESAGVVNGTLCYSTSTDGGATWTAQTSVYQVPAYMQFACDSDSNSRIDFILTDGQIARGDTANTYHMYYQGGSFQKSDGTTISATKPFAPSATTKIYDGATNGSVSTDVSLVSSGPTVAFAAANTGGWASHPENNWYGVWNGSSWNVHLMADTGQIPNVNFNEPGVAVSRSTPSQVFVSRAVSGVVQVFLYKTSDNGVTWSNQQLSFSLGDPNIFPIVPRNEDSRLRALWLSGPQTPTSFSCQVLGYPNPNYPA